MKASLSQADFRVQLYRFLNGYGMLLVLLLLCGYYSWVTWAEQHPTGIVAANQLSQQLLKQTSPGASVLIVTRNIPDDRSFANRLQENLSRGGLNVREVVSGEPPMARHALEQIGNSPAGLQWIACTAVVANWSVFQDLSPFGSCKGAKLIQPQSYWWPNFLKTDNLLNVANQIAVIAIIAIGMTTVIIAGGIDLSVGSLIALSAVAATRLIRDYAGGEQAHALGMTICCLAAIVICGGVGAFSGVIVTQFGVPPFIVTLGTMLVGSGWAYTLAQGQSIYQVPESFIWLGRGANFGGIPNSVVLMLLLYVFGFLFMERMVVGRFIYAIGGNRLAALLSGVPVKRVIVLTYTLAGAFAGLGGIITASQLKSGAPTYGFMYELYVIAAVVVGGTSLLGGEGRILGTLIGALIIGVIQNGMNLTGVESYTQKVVLGFLILGAVLLDRLRKVSLDRLLR